MTPTRQSSAGDFDFSSGAGASAHHQAELTPRPGCNEWIEFTGTSVAQKILGGIGNLDDNTLDLPGGAYRAAK
ncbi:MAG: hypothetical protein IPP88_21965 [Betaproteobacteria bacterium]|nr:hypothetical protein [Betaproteobacteria bacterium]